MKLGESRKPKQRTIKKPADVFRSCPACDSSNLIDFDAQLFCEHCDWNSVGQHCKAEIDLEFEDEQARAATLSSMIDQHLEKKDREKVEQKTAASTLEEVAHRAEKFENAS